jgi:hypothetical protein
MLGIFTNICRHFSVALKVCRKNDTLHEHLHTSPVICCHDGHLFSKQAVFYVR